MNAMRDAAGMCLLVTAMICGTGCGKAEDSGKPGASGAPAAQAPARASAKPEWETKTALDLVTFTAPRGAGWTYSYEMAWHGSLDAPEAVFAVRSGTEVKNLIESAAAVSKGDATIAGRAAVLHEGKAPDWGPIKIWALKEPHPASDKTVAIVVAGHKQADYQAELDKIQASIKVELVKSE